MTISNQAERHSIADRPLRRNSLKGGLAFLFGFLLARQATAANAASTPPGGHAASSREWMDRLAVTDVIMRERWARETRNPEVAAACFHPDARVEVSWFKGSGAEFVEMGKREPPADTVNFDSMSPPVIWLQEDRAIADTPCAVHTVLRLDGVEVSAVSYTRLLWRVQKSKGRWLVAGLRGIYIRDTLQPTSPGQEVKLDEKRLNGYRPSYRHLSYVLAAAGRPPRDDLPGVDRPEMVDALRAGERLWLAQG